MMSGTRSKNFLRDIEVVKRRQIRRMFANSALNGMLSSFPLCDRTKVNKKKWAKQAWEWADAMIDTE